MKQIIVHGSSSLPGTSASGITSFGGNLFTAVAATANTPWAVAGTFRNFTIRVTTAPGTGKSWTVVPHVNDVATSVSVTIAGTALSASDTSNSFTVSPGDTLTLVWTPSGSPSVTSAAYYSVEFEGDNANESGYAQAATSLNSAATRRTGVFWPCHDSASVWSSSAGSDLENVVPTSGNITALYVTIDGNPGGPGKSYTFNIYKNGVKQDGTGGTVDTTVTIANAATAGSGTFTLPVVAGDLVYLECTPSGTPSGRAGNVGVRFAATVDGESIVGGRSGGTLSQSAAEYHRFPGYSASGQGSDGITAAPGNPTGFALGKFYVRAYTPPGSGTSYAFTVQKNGAVTSLAATVSDASQNASDLLDSVGITSGDTFSLRITPMGTPDATRGTWSAVQVAGASQKRGCFVVGVTTRVTGTRSAAFGLDGNTNVHSESGKLKVFGDFEVTGTTTVEDLAVNGTVTGLTVGADSVTNVELANMAEATFKGRAAGAGTGDPVDLTPDQASTILDSATDPFVRTSNLPGGGTVTKTVGITIDGGGSVITTGTKGYVSVPITGTITKARMLSTVSGSIVIDVWKDTYANYPPTDADSITAAAPPALSGASQAEDTTLTGWTTSVTAGDILGFNVDSAATVTRVTLELTVEA